MCINPRNRSIGRKGTTLIELTVMVGVSSLIVTAIATMFVFSLKSFAGIGNYSALSGQSRMTLDLMSRDIREATELVAADTNMPTPSITLTNGYAGTTIVYKWNSTNGTVTTEITGQPTRTNLTGCDSWSFSFYQRTPTNNWLFYPTTGLSDCKLINMSWKCSRSVLGQKLNTEDVTTAQIVLRNKP